MLGCHQPPRKPTAAQAASTSRPRHSLCCVRGTPLCSLWVRAMQSSLRLCAIHPLSQVQTDRGTGSESERVKLKLMIRVEGVEYDAEGEGSFLRSFVVQRVEGRRSCGAGKQANWVEGVHANAGLGELRMTVHDHLLVTVTDSLLCGWCGQAAMDAAQHSPLPASRPAVPLVTVRDRRRAACLAVSHLTSPQPAPVLACRPADPAEGQEHD